MAKIPETAFSEYLGLGTGRSYQQLADLYDVSKRSIVKVASREHWQERLEEIERTANAEVEKKAVESIVSINARHLKVIRWIQGRALETLKDTPLRSTTDALKALEFSLREERHLTRADDVNAAATSDNQLEGLSPEFMKELHKQAHEFVHRTDRMPAFETTPSARRPFGSAKLDKKVKDSPES